MVTRVDEWTREQDAVLVNTVIEGVRIGRTQLDSFNMVAREISRTSGACGYRWNAVLRYKHADEFSAVRLERMKKEDYLRTKRLIEKRFASVKITSDTPVWVKIDMSNPLRPSILISDTEPTRQEVDVPHHDFAYIEDTYTYVTLGKDAENDSV